jgi:hypothetical protein
MIVDFNWGEFQDFADSHTACGHELQDQPVSDLRRSEDNLIHRLLFDNVPEDGLPRPADFPQHRGIARVLKVRIEIGPDEIEEGFEVGVATLLCLLISALSDLAEKRQDLFGCDGGKLMFFARVVTEVGEGGVVGLDRAFLQRSSGGGLCASHMRKKFNLDTGSTPADNHCFSGYRSLLES